MSEAIEDIILRHSQRGMLTLKEYVPEHWARKAAQAILSWQKGTVFLTTGFYVAGYAETDGPAGTMTAALALRKLGYHPVIVTDAYCKGFFELKDLDVIYVPLDADEAYFRRLLTEWKPAGMISIERCGENIQNDYANMRGVSIKAQTARIDIAFDLAPEYGIPTVGVGDGGNEIGMGNVKDVISEKLSLVPCRNTVDHLVIASVSNWGAYGITAYLQQLSKEKVFLPFDEIEQFIKDTVAIGSVDGITHERINHVDGFDDTVEAEIINALHEAAAV